MKTMALIDEYRKAHRGKSAFIDERMLKAEQAILDAERTRDPDFVLINLYIGRGLMADLLEAIRAPEGIRRTITAIRASFDHDIEEREQKRTEAAT